MNNDRVTIEDSVLSILDWTNTNRRAADAIRISSAPDENTEALTPTMRISAEAGRAPVSATLILDRVEHYPAVGGAIKPIAGNARLRIATRERSQVEFAILVEQGGIVYAGPRRAISGQEWTTASFEGLGEAQFTKLDAAGADRVALGCRSRPIRFGFGVFFPGNRASVSEVAVADWNVSFDTSCCKGLRQKCCGDEGVRVDEDGAISLPDNTDPFDIDLEYYDQEVGDVNELYPDADTSTAHWYERFPCETAVGGDPGLTKDLAFEDFVSDLQQAVGEAVEDIAATVWGWGTIIAEHETELLTTWPSQRIVAPYTPKLRQLPTGEAKQHYAFGGRDIVFVHGLKLEHLGDKMLNLNNQAKWRDPVSFPADQDNPEFYSGYFKETANNGWVGQGWQQGTPPQGHVRKFLSGKKNRFLVVSYSNSERAEVAARSVLTQIGDAMSFGTGVVDLANLNGPPPNDFGAAGFVIVSHSTGALITDIAMWAADKYPAMGASHIPQYAKAHVSSHGVFQGSPYATAALVQHAMAIEGFQAGLGWWSGLVGAITSALGLNLGNNLADFMTLAGASILVDLVPQVAQMKWGGAVSSTPVRTLMIGGAHPTDLFPVAFPLLPGLNDGVSPIASQFAIPNNVEAWPPAIRTPLGAVHKNFDLGVFGPPSSMSVNIGGQTLNVSVSISSTAMNHPRRATHWFAQQKLTVRALLSLAVAPPSSHHAFFASSAVPYLAPSGMLMTGVGFYPQLGLPPYPTTAYPWNRTVNHFSFIQSASDHFVGTHDAFPGHQFDFQDYQATLNLVKEANREEILAITDSGIYAPYGSDGVPLLKPANRPPVVERIRGVRVSYTIKLWKVKIRRTRWVWMRRYHLLKDWENKMQFDYVYGSILRD